MHVPEGEGFLACLGYAMSVGRIAAGTEFGGEWSSVVADIDSFVSRRWGRYSGQDLK